MAPPLQEDVVAAALAQRNIPPHHPEATTPEEAYRSDELVPPMVADALEVRKLFPATNKPDYREQLRSSGQVRVTGSRGREVGLVGSSGGHMRG